MSIYLSVKYPPIKSSLIELPGTEVILMRDTGFEPANSCETGS